MAAHAVSCRAVGVSFIPLAIESLGGWSELGATTLAASWVRDWAFAPQPPLVTCSRGAQCLCGEGMLLFG